MGLHIIDEANRCLGCKKAMCQMACPVSTPIPKIIDMFKKNDLMGAGEILFENNPMSVVCAMVCNHEAQCMGHCIKGKKDIPVHFYEIEKFISDAYLDRMTIPTPEKKGKNVAVIGCGPAGMTVAMILAKNGYGVTVFEEKNKIGGMLQYGIPEFRLSRTYMDRYKKRMLEMGIKIRPNTVMGGSLKIDDLFRDGYASVFVSTGVWRPKTLGIQGESLPNVHYGISFLANPGSFLIGENVAVIGMGNVAMDVARTAFRKGAQKVTMYARGKRIAASSHEVQYAQLDGAELVFGKAIEKITPDGPVFKVSIFDENDKVIGYEEELEQVYADSVIIAASQGPKNKLTSTTSGLESDDKGLLVVDENGKTTKEGVFAAGDVVTGPKTVVHAVEGAKIAAKAMMEYMEAQN